jgi:hypothetical protein
MHPKKNLLLLLIFLLPFWLQAQNADAVIKKYVAFIGGKKNWEKVKTLTTSGKYNYGGIEFPFTAYAKSPNRYKFIVPTEGKYYAQGFDGEKGWKIDLFKNETTPTLLTGKTAQSMANEADVEFQNAFIDYKRKGHTATLEQMDTIDGKSCIGVKLTRQNGEVETYYFDEGSSALVMKTAASKNAELQGTILNTRYSDYRDVNGIKIPFKAIHKSNEQLVLEVSIDKAEVNTAIDDREFQPQNSP